MIQASFEQKLKKGDLAEEYIRTFLEEKGFIVYQPVTKDKPHWIDMLAVKGKDDAIALDIKCKPRMKYYNATGIDKRHYMEYDSFMNKYKIPFFILFVDELEKRAYGNWIKRLNEPFSDNGVCYPKTLKSGQIIWALKSMKHICDLNENFVEKLVELRTSKYGTYQKR